MDINVKIEGLKEMAKAIDHVAEALMTRECYPWELQPKTIEKATKKKDSDTAPEEDPTQYEGFNVMAESAKRLRDADLDTYENVLNKYVSKGKKYSAIDASDWPNATRDFNKAYEALDWTGNTESVEPIEDKNDEDSYDVPVVEPPRLDLKGLRALCAKAKGAGVHVGDILFEVSGIRKLSDIPDVHYNEIEDLIKKEMGA